MSQTEVLSPDLLDVILSRRSVRQFRPDLIPVEVLRQLLAAAQAAPYGTASDEREFVVLGRSEKDEFLGFLGERFDEVLPGLQDAPSQSVLKFARNLVRVIASAPVVVAVFTAASEEGHTLALPSAAVAVQNLLLAAWAKGLAGCYTTGGVYLADDIAEYLDMPGRQLVALVPLGYPANVPNAKERPADAVTWRGFAEIAERSRPRPRPPTPPLCGEAGCPSYANGAGHRVLIVDGENPATRHLTALLEEARYEVNCCVVATEAPGVVRDWEPDVVIIDALLPGTSGYEVCAALRAEATGFLPIVITTTAYNAADVAHGLMSEADEVLLKPVSPHELLAALHSLMRAKALYSAVQAQAEELREANEYLRELERLRDDLTHMIVHDLRTPLTNVIGNLQTLQETEYDPELVTEFVPVAIEAGQTLLGMVNDLLDISKMESGQMTLDRQEFAVAEVVEAALANVRGLAEQKGLELAASVEPPGLRLNADQDQVRRCLVNLLGNALKFTREGHVRLQVTRRDGQVVFAVEDTGEGIPEADRERIFAKFGQVETRKAGRKMSTGLGLTFVKLSAEAHGGRVWVESELGKGSTFYMSLPG